MNNTVTQTRSSGSSIANSFRESLECRRPLTGIWSMLNSFNVTEGLALAGFDWILIDGEHAPVSLQDVMTHLRVLAGMPTVPIVRLPWNDSVMLKQYLDIGTCTIMLPYIQTEREARAAVAAMHYPPRGRRGVAAMHRASCYGFQPGYLQNASETLYLIVQVETLEALENVEAIANVDGVDAVFFGPGDLAASMGKLGEPGHPAVTEAIDLAAAIVRSARKATGVLANTPDLAERYLRGGYDFVSIANDAALLFSTASVVAQKHRLIVNDVIDVQAHQ